MNPDGDNQPLIKIRRLVLMLLAITLSVVVITLLGLRFLSPSHPQFGAIYEASAFEAGSGFRNQFLVFLVNCLPRRIVQSPMFPSRLSILPTYLRLGNQKLQWSTGGNWGDSYAGWLYFSRRGRGSSPWEFSTCEDTNLTKITEIPTDFYGSSAPRITEVFQATSTTNAIQVLEGQILFARLTDETNLVYVLKLKDQDMKKLVVDYCMTTVK